uniref:Uncharacterized protein n=1 Tax=Siphoviridae sp. ctGFb30 TaxID=2826219 RepID=A0A8S5MFB8_9CAUD|nr:MAG TPA: hypothetical protein [Siphoviridae sp. ctGFb30]
MDIRLWRRKFIAFHSTIPFGMILSLAQRGNKDLSRR